MAGTHLRFSPIVYMIKAQMASYTSCGTYAYIYVCYVFTSCLKSIYVEIYYLHTNTSIKVNICHTQRDIDWLPTYKLQLTYGIIMEK